MGLLRGLLMKDVIFKIAIKLMRWAFAANDYQSDDALLELAIAYRNKDKNLIDKANAAIDAIQADVTRELKG
jgi:hypothetical protein